MSILDACLPDCNLKCNKSAHLCLSNKDIGVKMEKFCYLGKSHYFLGGNLEMFYILLNCTLWLISALLGLLKLKFTGKSIFSHSESLVEEQI